MAGIQVANIAMLTFQMLAFNLLTWECLHGNPKRKLRPVISFSQEFPVGNSYHWFYRASMPDVGMARFDLLALQRLAFYLLAFKFLTL